MSGSLESNTGATTGSVGPDGIRVPNSPRTPNELVPGTGPKTPVKDPVKNTDPKPPTTLPVPIKNVSGPAIPKILQKLPPKPALMNVSGPAIPRK